MKYAAILLTIAAFACTAIFSYHLGKMDCPKYYDGEGNEIPMAVVNNLVKSQFVIMGSTEEKELNKYFYFRTLNK
jgi:uncharacterized membrane protein